MYDLYLSSSLCLQADCGVAWGRGLVRFLAGFLYLPEAQGGGTRGVPRAHLFLSAGFFGFTGCQEIAEEFRSQEIDGQALLLLKEEHLMSAMNIKLGPALKICAKINVLKET